MAVLVRKLGLAEYQPVLDAMRELATLGCQQLTQFQKQARDAE